MKSLYKRIISGALVFVTMFFVCVPTVFASDLGSLDTPARGDFWAWVQMKDNAFKSIFDKDICPKSPNINGLHEFVKANTTIDGKTGLYYVCKHCGKSAGEVGEGVYQQQVESLPAPIYSSVGALSWKIVPYVGYINDSRSESKRAVGERFVDSVRASGTSTSTGSVFVDFILHEAFFAPIDGTYSLFAVTLDSYKASAYLGASHNLNKVVFTGGTVLYAGTLDFASSNCVLRVVFSSDYEIGFWCGYLLLSCVPHTVPSGDTYNINTRPTTITGGNYGIVGDDNNITTVTNTTQIINEGDNLYYNPATGQTQTITDWTYNYDGRIYNITLDTGDKVSVEYGDENITITENTVNEGDTIVNNYTIYYMIDGSGSGESHTHEWYKTGERQATCLVPAQRTYTCSICGEQKTETDPVLGHSWHVIQTVTTQYDEKGIQTQEGYTIYECERCGEQYKSTNNTGPPPSGGGGSGGGTSENIFTGIFGLIWDFFTFLFDLFSEFVVGGIKGFIDGLKDAGSSFFSILNPFDWGY